MKTPTNTIFSNVADPGEGASADRMNCQRQPTTKFAIEKTRSVPAIRGRLAWLMSSAAWPRSNRIANANISPAVTKMRALVTRILTMAVTPAIGGAGSMPVPRGPVNACEPTRSSRPRRNDAGQNLPATAARNRGSARSTILE